MKRQTLYNLIAAHYANDKIAFARAARTVARDLHDEGETKLAKAIDALNQKNSKVVLSSAKGCTQK